MYFCYLNHRRGGSMKRKTFLIEVKHTFEWNLKIIIFEFSTLLDERRNLSRFQRDFVWN